MTSMQAKTTPLLRENPVTLHVPGICSALAITNSLTSSLIMSVALPTVLIISNAAINAVRHCLPSSVRLLVQITIIASAVTVIDQFLKVYMPDAARTLSVYSNWLMKVAGSRKMHYFCWHPVHSLLWFPGLGYP